MKPLYWIVSGVILLVIVTSALVQKCAQESNLEEQSRDVLRMMMEEASVSCKMLIEDEMVHACDLTSQFYKNRNYDLAWHNLRGPLAVADSLLDAIVNARKDGLNPDDYHRNEITRRLTHLKDEKEEGLPVNLYLLIDLDILLTDAFFLYASHLLSGRVDPETIDPVWLSVSDEDVDLIQYLEFALDRGGIHRSLENLLPQLPMYIQLRDALAKYRKIAWHGGWPSVPEGGELKKGDRGYRVAALMARLMTSGDLPKDSLDETVIFDDSLESVVKQFQIRHGILPDGKVGEATMRALNTSAESYVQKIEINMERWRWLPRNLGERYIFVNIANFEMSVIEFQKPVMDMRVVVGKYYRRTPIFSGLMTYLVINPFWNVPNTVADQDILPKVKENRNFLYERDIKIIRNWTDEGEGIDPETIFWDTMTIANFPYLFRQDPGDDNALGRIKFMFPNKYDVYLHDTPSRSLFKRNIRAYSSGCIRIEYPVDLAEYLLKGDEKWNRDAILHVLENEKNIRIQLPAPIPVHIFYSTAFVDENGIPHFRKDIYDRDEKLANGLYAQLAPFEFD